MHRTLWIFGLLALAGSLVVSLNSAHPEPTYQRKGSRVETVVASLQASDLPTLQGPWHWIGPFPNVDNAGFDRAYPPEKEIDLKKTYPGRDGMIGWQAMKTLELGKIVNLKPLLAKPDHSVLYFVHQFEAREAMDWPISLGSDDSLKVFHNGKVIVEDGSIRGAQPDQNQAILKVVPGKNTLLIKVTNGAGDFALYLAPELPSLFPAVTRKMLDRDFPQAVAGQGGNPATRTAEAKYYRITTLDQPKDCVLEVGGIGGRPDGNLLVCTRRGEIWLVKNPHGDPEKMEWKLWANGLHESLGMLVDGKDVFVVQRPELTRLRDTDGDEQADEFTTICDKWGVSGDYHEFAFGPARDRNGNFHVTLNVGFGGGHQAKSPWRGWCVQISPKGEMTPFATGLRSPNGVNFSPEGDLFYCDNQGEWTATNKMHHIQRGEFYGHQAGLKWVKQSPFAQTIQESYPSGMLYDGQKGKEREGFPPHVPPCIWFPYDKMGKSVSEPIWDTTGGKFGPFPGQCFVGDQTKSMIMRVYLEKVQGRYQGACFPFRGGFQCGVNRLQFGPDGQLYVGQTNRGWGSLGGKPYGLERLTWTGELPFEIHSMKLVQGGFELFFTKPLDLETAGKPAGYNLASHTYHYWPAYGSPPQDNRAERITNVKVGPTGQSVVLEVEKLRVGRVYELNVAGTVKSRDGEGLLHAEAYYTLNNLP